MARLLLVLSPNSSADFGPSNEQPWWRGILKAPHLNNESKGVIFVYSEPGCGTTFKIYLRVSRSRSRRRRERR
jgi:hypothetical protein